MRKENIAFKKKLHESRIRTERRANLQRAGGLLALGASLVMLYVHYLH
ncbi:MAG TPA: hypothetical protein VL051_03745 [Burkholderiaceae bacterium]|nr:hypothetical protein [Burkholderiaceae bacterium]